MLCRWVGAGALSTSIQSRFGIRLRSARVDQIVIIGYSNKEVDKLIDKAREELDKQKRIPLFQEIYRKIAEDAPYAFMFNDKFVLYAINSRIQQPKDTFKFAIGREYFAVKAAAE